MSLFRNRLQAIAKRSGPIITVINLVGAFSSTTALFLPNTPTPYIITVPSSNHWVPPIIEQEDKRPKLNND